MTKDMTLLLNEIQAERKKERDRKRPLYPNPSTMTISDCAQAVATLRMILDNSQVRPRRNGEQEACVESILRCILIAHETFSTTD